MLIYSQVPRAKYMKSLTLISYFSWKLQICMFTRVCMGREIELLTWTPLAVLSCSKCFFLANLLRFYRVTIPPFALSFKILPRLGARGESRVHSLAENSHLSLNVRGRQLPTPPIHRAALLQACESDPFRTEVLSPTTCSVLRSTFSNFPHRCGSLPDPVFFFSSLFSPGERNKAEICEKNTIQF